METKTKQEKMARAARICIEKLAKVQQGERVLIITDTICENVGQALYAAAAKDTENAFLLKIPVGKEHGAEPPKMATGALKQCDVFFAPTEFSITHTKAVMDAIKLGARGATMPGITEEMFARAIDVDYDEMHITAQKLYAKLVKTSKLHITTASGTDVYVVKAAARRIITEDGIMKKGMNGPINLPTGEVCLAPKEGATTGLIVVDNMAGCRPKAKISVRSGLVQEIVGDDDFKKKVFSMKNMRNIAELGIGINPKATLSGRILEDEKVLGTCHIALGTSAGLGGTVRAAAHWDAILLQPTIMADGEKIMHEGELLV